MDSNKHILDVTGYRKSRVYGGADIIQGVSKNALQLDGLLSTGANLGNFSKTCLSEPLSCKNGFSVAFWMKIDTRNIKDDSYQVVFQVSRMQQSIGTTFYAKRGILGLSVNDRNFSRTVEINWNITEWTHLTLIWNRAQDSVNIFMNCAGNNVIRNEKAKNMFYMVPPQHQMWLGSNYALMKNCKLAIDELAIWYVVLSVQEICYIHKVKAGMVLTTFTRRIFYFLLLPVSLLIYQFMHFVHKDQKIRVTKPLNFAQYSAFNTSVISMK